MRKTPLTKWRLDWDGNNAEIERVDFHANFYPATDTQPARWRSKHFAPIQRSPFTSMYKASNAASLDEVLNVPRVDARKETVVHLVTEQGVTAKEARTLLEQALRKHLQLRWDEADVAVTRAEERRDDLYAQIQRLKRPSHHA